jgi:hypothetical protein
VRRIVWYGSGSVVHADSTYGASHEPGSETYHGTKDFLRDLCPTFLLVCGLLQIFWPCEALCLDVQPAEVQSLKLSEP